MLGELVADKLPFTPARTGAGPFTARIVTGAFAGAVFSFQAEMQHEDGLPPGSALCDDRAGA